MSEGIYQGFELAPGDTPWTVALDLSKTQAGHSSRQIALEILVKSGNASILKEN